jgi:hypothetical protein
VSFMPRCPAHTVYVSTKEKLSLKQSRVTALLGDREIEITHRHQIGELMAEFGWNGTCRVESRLGESSPRVLQLDDRIVAGHLPENAAMWRMRQVQEGAALTDVGGPKQLAETLFGVSSKQLGKVSYASIAAGRGHSVAMLSAACRSRAGEPLLSVDALVSILDATQNQPASGLFIAQDPKEWKTLGLLLEGLDESVREQVLQGLLTRLPDGVTPALATKWAADDERARWLLEQGDWGIVHAVLKERNGSDPEGWKGARALRSRDIIGACERRDRAALRVALQHDELRELALKAYVSSTHTMLSNNGAGDIMWDQLFEHAPAAAMSLVSQARQTGSWPIVESLVDHLDAVCEQDPLAAVALANRALDLLIADQENGEDREIATFSVFGAVIDVATRLPTSTPALVDRLLGVQTVDADLGWRLRSSLASSMAGLSAFSDIEAESLYREIVDNWSGPTLENPAASALSGIIASREDLGVRLLVEATAKGVLSDRDLSELLSRLGDEAPSALATAGSTLVLSSDPAVQQAAVLALRDVHRVTPELTEALAHAILSPSEQVRAATIQQAAAWLGQDSSMLALVQAGMNDSSPQVQKAALNQAGRIFAVDQSAAASMFEQALSSNSNLALEAAQTLPVFLPFSSALQEKHTALLQIALEHPSPEVRSAGFDTVASLLRDTLSSEGGHGATAKLVATAARDEASHVRAKAVLMLPTLRQHDPDLAEALYAEALSDSDAQVAAAVFRTLGKVSRVDVSDVRAKFTAALAPALGTEEQERVDDLAARMPVFETALDELGLFAAVAPSEAFATWKNLLDDVTLYQDISFHTAERLVKRTEVLLNSDALNPRDVVSALVQSDSWHSREAAAKQFSVIAGAPADVAFEALATLLGDDSIAVAHPAAISQAAPLFRQDPQRALSVLGDRALEPEIASALIRVLPDLGNSNEAVVKALIKNADAVEVARAIPTLIERAPDVAVQALSRLIEEPRQLFGLEDAVARVAYAHPSEVSAMITKVSTSRYYNEALCEAVDTAIMDLISDGKGESAVELVQAAALTLHADDPSFFVASHAVALLNTHPAQAKEMLVQAAASAPGANTVVRFLPRLAERHPDVVADALAAATTSGAMLDPEHTLDLAANGFAITDPTLTDVINAWRAVRSDVDAAQEWPKVRNHVELLGLAARFSYEPEVLEVLDAQPCSALARPLTTRVIKSRTELERNAADMGNCTRGYAQALQNGDVMMAFRDANGRPVINAHLTPGPSGWVVSQVNSQDNSGGDDCAAVEDWLKNHLEALA